MKNSPLNVSYQGERVGQLAEASVKGRRCIFFEYDPAFLRRGIELSPLNLPLRPGLITREGTQPSDKLPGLFEDSIPDRWGRQLLYDWFRRRGLPQAEITPLMMLGYVGDRSMGALSYEPEDSPTETGAVDLTAIYREAITQDSSTAGTTSLNELLADIGSPPGGAQPKVLLALPIDGSLQCRGGAHAIPAGHEAWLVKFTPPHVSLDNLGTDARMEEAYALMARAAGIELPPTRLLPTTSADGERLHFAVRRFDRENGRRIHHHTLAGLTHLPGGDLDYETLLMVTRRITRDERQVLHAFRRAVFNVMACNDDDHGRNHGFLLPNQEWHLGPAYDLTFRKLRDRGLAVAGVRHNPTRNDLITLANRAALDRNAVASIIDEVQSSLARWPEFATQAQVPADMASYAAASFRL